VTYGKRKMKKKSGENLDISISNYNKETYTVDVSFSIGNVLIDLTFTLSDLLVLYDIIKSAEAIFSEKEKTMK